MSVDNKAMCQKVVQLSGRFGAQGAITTLSSEHEVTTTARAGKIEKLAEADSATMSVVLFVDGRYAVHSTNDLGEAAVERFLKRAIAATRLLDADPDRQLPAPALFEGRARALDGVLDESRSQRSVADRKREALALEAETQATAGERLVSATATVTDSRVHVAKATSNGFVDEQLFTSFMHSASVTLKDGDKRPEDGHYVSARLQRGVPAAIGKEAAQRALSRLGQKRTTGGERLVLIENRVVPRLLGMFLQAASGHALWQKRSFLDGKLDQPVMSKLVNLLDDPLLPGGLGSRRFDGEGLTAKRRALVEGGVFRSFNLDTYYARRLGKTPTSGSYSNLVLEPGKGSRATIEKGATNLLVINRVIGGNSNQLTGDFSLGIGGYLLEGGQRTPVAEMNLSGNHLTFWQRIVEVCDDPWIYSSARTPSLLLDKVAIA